MNDTACSASVGLPYHCAPTEAAFAEQATIYGTLTLTAPGDGIDSPAGRFYVVKTKHPVMVEMESFEQGEDYQSSHARLRVYVTIYFAENDEPVRVAEVLVEDRQSTASMETAGVDGRGCFQ